jgi:hypothetical protein
MPPFVKYNKYIGAILLCIILFCNLEKCEEDTEGIETNELSHFTIYPIERRRANFLRQEEYIWIEKYPTFPFSKI